MSRDWILREAGEPRLEDAADRHSDVGGESGSARIIRMEDV